MRPSAFETRAYPISMYRKRPFATHRRGRHPVRAAVCRIPCLILCLANVKRVGQCRAPHAPCGVHGRMASVIAHDGDPEYSLITRSSDGQLLFLANMLSKMKHGTPLGSRIAEVHNGSSLFTGDAGQGESNIRRWIIENDWLEALVALPLNMFYNTGIATYIWVLTNRKPAHQRGKVQLIRERQREGIALAKQRGAYRGRKKALSPEQAAELRHRVKAGARKAPLARELGISRETLYQYLRTDD